MHFYSLSFFAGLLAVPVSAFWRLPCVTPLVEERADPIINPGAVSSHLHTIMGGNGFGLTMTYDTTQTSTCSSCTVHGDFSNYWTPVLFYRHQDGTFEKVDQVGGATVYYLQRNAAGEKIQAFPKGFRMVAGDPFKRAAGTDAASQAISYNCLDYNGPARPETGGFPSANCPDGLRAQVFFPSCWDGKNLDSPSHKSHVAYPDGAYNAGKCPSTHPVRLISIFYEIIWDTNKFRDQWYGSSQPFVWSNGDPTGYGSHGDFINGWDVDLLQRAVDTCTNLSGRVEDCPVFTLTPSNTAQGCTQPPQIAETVTGLLPALPGCNPVQPGPDPASPSPQSCPSASIPSILTHSVPTFTDLTSRSWSYLGCGTDNYYDRTLRLASTSSDNMTNTACVAFCDKKGPYTYAATEYGRECYCGNTVPVARLPVPGTPGTCHMVCAGDEAQMCGGSAVMSLYQRCTGGGGKCENGKGVVRRDEDDEGAIVRPRLVKREEVEVGVGVVGRWKRRHGVSVHRHARRSQLMR